TAVALSPLSLLSPSQTVILMLAVNLAATGLILMMALGLWGRQWTLREKVFLCSLFLVWASFRITVRNSQLSLVITALILGFIWMRRQKRAYAAGILLGLSLIKYPVSFLFLIYTFWKKEWKTAGIAVGMTIALTLVYAARLDLSPIRIIQDYARDIAGNLSIKDTAFTGSTEIKPMIDHFLGGQPRFAIAAALVLWTAALLALGIALRRARGWEDAHLAAVSLLTLWSIFHRPYDSVLLIIPAAVLVDFRRRPGGRRFAECGLVMLGLFAISVPGLLTDRLGLDVTAVARNPIGFVGLHLERLIVLTLFTAMLILMIKHRSVIPGPASNPAPA